MYKCTILVLAVVMAADADPVAVSVQPSDTNVNTGATFTIDISISGVADLFAWQFDLGFDPLVISAASTSEGLFLTSAGSTLFVPGAIDNAGGVIAFTSATLTGPGPGASGSGLLATIELQALQAGSSALTLSNVVLLDSSLLDISAIAIGGSVDVSAGQAVPEPVLMLPVGLLLAAAILLRRQHTIQSAARRQH